MASTFQKTLTSSLQSCYSGGMITGTACLVVSLYRLHPRLHFGWESLSGTWVLWTQNREVISVRPYVHLWSYPAVLIAPNFMEESSWEANSHSASQEIP